MFKNRYLLVVGLGLIFLVAWLYRDYGVSYDEAVHLNNGDWIIAWYGSLGKVDSAVTAISCKYYSGLADVVTQALANTGTMLFGWDPFEERHFITALIGLLGILYTYRLGSLFGGPITGGVAGLILLLTPRWFGHMFDNPKDIPFAAAYVASLYYLLEPWFLFRPSLSSREGKVADGYDWIQCLKIGVAFGFALGTRIGGVFLYVSLTLSVVLSVVVDRSGRFWDPFWLKEISVFFIPRMFLILVISWTIMILFWPYAMISPLIRPFQVMDFMSNNPWEGSVLFQGGVYPAAHIPILYLPTWLLISLPEFYFLGLALGFVVVIYRVGKSPLRLAVGAPYFMVFFAIIFPVLVIMLKRSPLYDGMRHVTFLVPPLAVLTAIGLRSFWRIFPARPVRWILGATLALTVGLVVFDLVTLHPYQNIYFNRLFAGGLKEGLSKFDGDYWGQTYHSGAEWIGQHYPTESFNIGVPYMAKRLGYYFDRQEQIKARQKRLLGFLKGKYSVPPPEIPRLRVVGPDWDGVSREDGTLFQNQQFRLYLSGIQFRANERISGKVLFTIRRQGVTLLEVKEVAQSP